MTNIPNLLDEAAGSKVAEENDRKNGIAALLTRQIVETARDYPTLRHLPLYVLADMVHACIAAGAAMGWRIWKTHAMCSVCRKSEAVKQIGKKVLSERQTEYLRSKWTGSIETFNDGTGI